MEVPPSSWIEDMRTPAADLILMEFHRQKYSTEGEADGQENTSPNSAFHTDPAPHPDSPISGLLLVLCCCPSACGFLRFCKQFHTEAICFASHDMQLNTDSFHWNPLCASAVKDAITLPANMFPVFCPLVMPVSNFLLWCKNSTGDCLAELHASCCYVALHTCALSMHEQLLDRHNIRTPKESPAQLLYRCMHPLYSLASLLCRGIWCSTCGQVLIRWQPGV